MGRLLYESGDFVVLDGKTLPVDYGIGTVGYVECLGIGMAETYLAVNYLGTIRIGVGMQVNEKTKQ
jgi:hypothetical protein